MSAETNRPSFHLGSFNISFFIVDRVVAIKVSIASGVPNKSPQQQIHRKPLLASEIEKQTKLLFFKKAWRRKENRLLTDRERRCFGRLPTETRMKRFYLIELRIFSSACTDLTEHDEASRPHSLSVVLVGSSSINSVRQVLRCYVASSSMLTVFSKEMPNWAIRSRIFPLVIPRISAARVWLPPVSFKILVSR
ncbi:hypothetical protein Pan241w_17380 [Gimesia alba]|uniref:Uncharacterized protein n=1 Tax=Gimesia alba TaxID=2527973 RepID=A0A517RCR5_9PLAN|nr:hypothetical protein Pan241w_17380 [Gimesia alba]